MVHDENLICLNPVYHVNTITKLNLNEVNQSQPEIIIYLSQLSRRSQLSRNQNKVSLAFRILKIG